MKQATKEELSLDNDVFYVADESMEFAKQYQEDNETLGKKEADENE